MQFQMLLLGYNPNGVSTFSAPTNKPTNTKQFAALSKTRIIAIMKSCMAVVLPFQRLNSAGSHSSSTLLKANVLIDIPATRSNVSSIKFLVQRLEKCWRECDIYSY